MTTQLQKALQEYGEKMAKGMTGSIRSPHEEDLYCCGFTQAIELMLPLVEFLHEIEPSILPEGHRLRRQKALADLRKKVGME